RGQGVRGARRRRHQLPLQRLTCPGCGRPVAMARASCLYCGAALPTGTAEAVAAAAAPPPVAAPDRALLVLDLRAADPAPLRNAPGAAPLHAPQRAPLWG